jgi:hydrogenase-4 component F
MLWLLILIPAVAGLVCILSRSGPLSRPVLPAVAVVHFILVVRCWLTYSSPSVRPEWIGLDDAGLLFLGITSVTFLCTSFYAAGYIRREGAAQTRDMDEGFFFDNSPDAVFIGCLLFFLSTMTLVTLSLHLGLIWVAVEATTLSSTPLIYYHRHHRSLEATWKYLLICSVGIALAMLGNFFVVVAGSASGGQGVHLTLEFLLSHAAELNPAWLKAAFVLCLVGYGTKIGFAPLHTWMPATYSEAPSLVAALLSGALKACGFLALLRMHQVMIAAGLGDASRRLFVVIGVVSLVVAAAFIVRQADIKKMLAFSSVEHMGILALGIGVGGTGIFGSMFHVVNHSLAKTILFLAAGNIVHTYRSRQDRDIRELSKIQPATAVLWMIGALAIVGAPPFGTFLSELTILKAMVENGRYAIAAVYLLVLGVIFAAITASLFPMVFSKKSVEPSGEFDSGLYETVAHEPLWSLIPLVAMAAGILVLGVYMPPFLSNVFHGITLSLGGH